MTTVQRVYMTPQQVSLYVRGLPNWMKRTRIEKTAKKIPGRLRELNRAMFANEKPNVGAAWRPLHPRTVNWKKKNGYPLDILQRTGRLKRSLTSETGRDRVVRFKTTRNPLPRVRLKWGTRTPYAMDHFLGRGKPGQILPARRPIVVVGKRDVGRWVTNKLKDDYKKQFLRAPRAVRRT